MTASLLEDAFLLELDGCVFTLLELEAATEFGLIDEEDSSCFLLLDDGDIFTLLELDAEAAEFDLTDEEDLDFSTLEEDLSDFVFITNHRKKARRQQDPQAVEKMGESTVSINRSQSYNN